MASTTTAAREHVAEIRKTKFSIGGEPNPLTEDLHQAVKNLSAELYAKDVHFLMELIQFVVFTNHSYVFANTFCASAPDVAANAEDNEYPEGVDPSLEFVITSKDITNTGAPATLLVFNNEKGFSMKNIESICSVGRSTKKGLRKRGYIGEKGIGFKSVFLITSQPYIFSNGYQIKFNEKPCEHCNVGYIVPEWVEGDPTLSAIQTVYGSTTPLPTTTLVLPLKPEKVKPVKDQLSSVHPEVLLFLAKIRKLSVREENENPNLNTVTAISISSEKNFLTSKSMDAVSYTVHLTADDTNEEDNECGYYMWKQKFPVKNENKVEVRNEVEEWVITLAFPIGKRLKRGSNLPGIYSFLPTETVTNFPFIMQADFLLASSRENILWDSKWNQGILDCVPSAFLNAFISLVKSSETAPISSLPNMFRFLPITESSHSKLNKVRDSIKEKLMNETIIPCESYTTQKMFRKPNEVGRLNPSFWSILNKARTQGVSFSNISSHGAYLVSSFFDKTEYIPILSFLEIKRMDPDWYAKCIRGSNLVLGVSEEVYINLLSFISEYWGSGFHKTNMKNTPLIKYIGRDGKVDVFTPVSSANKLLAADSDSNHIPWLLNWNTEFQSSLGKFFLPKATQEAIKSCSNKSTLVNWLKEEMKVNFVTVWGYAELLSSSLLSSSISTRKMVVTYAHFLHNSLKREYLRSYEVENLCGEIPIVDKYGQVTKSRNGVLVPANGSKWVELIVSNPWTQHNYVELGEDYTHGMAYFGDVTSGGELISFLGNYIGASDIPDLSPPNAAIPTLSSPLTKRNTFLLLQWLRELTKSRTDLPERFLSSIKNGSWLKISLSGSSGSRPPSQSFMLTSSIGTLLQNGSVLVDIPLVDEKFYGQDLRKYEDELRKIGVRFQDTEAVKFIGDRLMALAASSQLTRDNVLSILKFMEYLGNNYISIEELVKSLRKEKWVRTSQGDKTPTDCVLYSHEWNAASQISNIPFLDKDYYGTDILSFKKELELLGVVIKFNYNYQFLVDNLKSSLSSTSLSSEAMLLVLNCVKNLRSSDKIITAVKNNRCLKTNLGYRSPSECFLSNPNSEWGCLLNVFRSFPILDEQFYGNSIFSMETELKKLGVNVDLETASKEFTRVFKQQASVSSITKENALLFLKCYKKLKSQKVKLPSDLKNCIKKEKWIKTKLGDFKPPNECILYSTEWEPVSQVSILPFIDENFYGSNSISGFRDELKRLGVVLDFKNGAKFVANGIFLPQDSDTLTPQNIFAILDSITNLKEQGTKIPPKLLQVLSQKNWIKTHFGYKRPEECLLFKTTIHDPFLKRNDGPFIDEEFYESCISSYENELKSLGIVTDTNTQCQLLSGYLESHTNFETISRIYKFLSTYKWDPVDDEESIRIWIPKGPENGKWVSSQDCVIHDGNGLFSNELNVLESYKYDTTILDFFARCLNVKFDPSVQDYCKLWKKWEENSGHKIPHKVCCAFWGFVVRNWNQTTEETFKNNLRKLPVLDPNSNEIILSEKRDVFIGDDLFLTDLFQTRTRPVFVWFPQPTSKTLTRTKLIDTYKNLGVRTLSESAQKHISDIDLAKFKPINSHEKIIKKGLLKLILAFLANVKIDVEKRHEGVNRVLAVKVFETPDKMSVKYSLGFCNGDVAEVEPRRMIRWDKQLGNLYMEKLERGLCGYKGVMEFGCHFAEEIAEGVLWDNEEVVGGLCELIRLGFLVEFDEDAVEFLLKVKNLEVFLEDREFLASIFESS
ncbi:hypothetical protein LXL04_030829 [Taraxacum kok-saghyz]